MRGVGAPDTDFVIVATARPGTDIPAAALPGGDVEARGFYLGPRALTTPVLLVDGISANVLMSRDSRLCFRVPDEASTGLIEARNPDGASNTVSLHIARELSDGLHPVTSPVVSRSGMIFATISSTGTTSLPGK